MTDRTKTTRITGSRRGRSPQQVLSRFFLLVLVAAFSEGELRAEVGEPSVKLSITSPEDGSSVSGTETLVAGHVSRPECRIVIVGPQSVTYARPDASGNFVSNEPVALNPGERNAIRVLALDTAARAIADRANITVIASAPFSLALSTTSATGPGEVCVKPEDEVIDEGGGFPPPDFEICSFQDETVIDGPSETVVCSRQECSDDGTAFNTIEVRRSETLTITIRFYNQADFDACPEPALNEPLPEFPCCPGSTTNNYVLNATRTISYHEVTVDSRPDPAPTVSLEPSGPIEVCRGEDVVVVGKVTDDEVVPPDSWVWTTTGGTLTVLDGSAVVDTSGLPLGVYTITLDVTDPEPCPRSGSSSVSFEVKENRFTVSITETTGPNYCEGDVARFTSAVEGCTDCTLEYQWTLGGAPAGSGPSLQVAVPGEQQSVALLVTCNGSTAVSNSIPIEGIPPRTVRILTVDEAESNEKGSESQTFRLKPKDLLNVHLKAEALSEGVPISPGSITWEIFDLNVAIPDPIRAGSGGDIEVLLPIGCYMATASVPSCPIAAKSSRQFCVKPTFTSCEGGNCSASASSGVGGLQTNGACTEGAAPTPDANGERAQNGDGTPCKACITYDLFVDPVHLATGQYYLSTPDLTITRMGRQVQFKRCYLSDPEDNGIFGPGWRHSYERRFDLYPGFGAIETKECGSIKFFPEDGDGGYVTGTLGVELQFNADGTTDVIYKHGSTYTYRIDGKLASIRDFNGNVTTLVYESNNLLTQVIDPIGPCFALEYTNGLLTKVSTVGGANVSYAYDPERRLAVSVDSRGQSASYTYGGDGRLSMHTDLDGTQTHIIYRGNHVVQTRQVDPSGAEATTQIEYPAPNVRHIIDSENGLSVYGLSDRGDQISRITPDGRVFTFERDAEGRLTKTTHPDGAVEHWSYDSDGDILTYTTPKNETYLVIRDADGDPTQLIRPDGSVIERSFTPEGNLSSTTDPEGRKTSFTYTPLGLLETTTKPDGDTSRNHFDSNGNVIGVEDALGNITTFVRDELGRIIKTTTPEGRTSGTEYEGQTLVKASIDGLNNRTEFVRDDLGRVVESRLPNGAKTKQTWVRIGGRDLVTRTEDPVGGITLTIHDSEGRVISRIDPLGRSTSFVLDATGRVTETISPDGTKTLTIYDKKGRVAKTIDSLGRETRRVYDDNDRVIETKAPDGSTTRTEYDPLGRVVRTIGPDSAATRTEYNDAGETIATIDALENRSEIVYSPEGDLEKVIDALRRETRFEYDDLDRLTNTVTSLGFPSQQAYDRDSNVILRLDANLHPIQMVLDELNRPKEVINPLGHSVKTKFDEVGNAVRIEDENGNAWTRKFDLASRMIEETDPNGNKTRFEHDLAGQLIKKIHADGTWVEMAYDVMGRLKSRTFKRADGTVDSTESFDYDKVGNRTLAENEHVRITSTYNIMDREVTRTTLYKSTGLERTLTFEYDIVGRRKAMEDDTGRKVVYGYDAISRLTQVTITEIVAPLQPGGPCSGTSSDTGSGGKKGKNKKGENKKVKLCHIPPGNPANAHTIEVSENAVAAHLAHGDCLGECGDGSDEVGPPEVKVRIYRMKYDEVSNLKEVLYPNHLRTRRAYDGDHRLTEIVHERLDEAGNVVEALATYLFERDDVGNILAITEADGSVFDFRYDDADQLVRAVLPSALVSRALPPERDDDPAAAQVLEYGYDPAGNRIREIRDGVTSLSTFSPANELLTSGGTTYVHDVRGNTTGAHFSTGQSHFYGFNVAGRMVSFLDPGVAQVPEVYAYGPGNQRVGVTRIDGTTVHSLWDGGRVIEEFGRPSGNAEDLEGFKYVWGLGQLLEQEEWLLQQVAAGPVQADHVLGRGVLGSLSDHLGSIRVLTDEAGQAVERTTWGPWGTRLEGGELSRFGYTGHSREKSSGLHFSVHRFLDPRNGRWTRRDPAGGVDGVNLYRYAMNRPSVLRDPTGLIVVGFLGGGGELDGGIGAVLRSIRRGPDEEVLAVNPGRDPFRIPDFGANMAIEVANRRKSCDERIVLFGYSRGAVTAWSVASFLGLANGTSVDYLGFVDAFDTPAFTEIRSGGVGSSVRFGPELLIPPRTKSFPLPSNVRKGQSFRQTQGGGLGAPLVGAPDTVVGGYFLPHSATPKHYLPADGSREFVHHWNIDLDVRVIDKLVADINSTLTIGR